MSPVGRLVAGLLVAAALTAACSGGNGHESTRSHTTTTTLQPTTTTICAQAAAATAHSDAGFRLPSAFGCSSPPGGFEVPQTLANAVVQNALAHPSVFYGGSSEITTVTCTESSRPTIGGPNGGNPDYLFTCDVQHADHSIVPVHVMVSPDGSQWGVVG